MKLPNPFNDLLSAMLFFLFAAGAGVKDLLAFWTGWEILPPTGQNLYVCVDDGKSPSSLPESKACFHKLSLSSQQTEYAALKVLLLKALKYGSRGYTSL